ncbi:hypothetical protein [Shigella flexneri]|uniref:hypothetical protein n=1 Tax=Shigella flexneri TaxID=623 RepID=UPI003EBFB4B2
MMQVCFGRLSFSQQQTDQPTSIASTYFGAGDMTELPRKYMTLDTGFASSITR